MDAETLSALEGSIEKWRAIVNGVGTDEGLRNCPLCQLFSKHNCVGCPVRETTGQGFCDYSPYNEWRKTFENVDPSEPRAANTADRLLIAVEEPAFLESLLPV